MDAIEQFKQEAAKLVQVRRHKASRESKWARMQEHFSQAGWYKLGDGFYGEAWANEHWPTLVLKISGRSGWGTGSRPSRNWETNRVITPKLDAWPVFAAHCKQHPHKCLPKVHHLEKVSEGVYWAVLPKYAPLDSYDDEMTEVQYAMKDAFYNSEGGREYPLAKWVKKLLRLSEEHSLSSDLHSGNFMVDSSTGTVIVTDPFTYSN